MEKYNETEYDFMKMGARCVVEGLVNLEKKAEEIGKLYGEQAKLEFEAGVANMISVYSSCLKTQKVTERELFGATSNYQAYDLRNDSYFDDEFYGEVSSKMVKDENGFVSYNEPKKKRFSFIRKNHS